MKLASQLFPIFCLLAASLAFSNPCGDLVRSGLSAQEIARAKIKFIQDNDYVWVILPSGIRYWGYYKCTGCGYLTSAYPNRRGKTRCSSCSKEHEGETRIETNANGIQYEVVHEPFLAPQSKKVGNEFWIRVRRKDLSKVLPKSWEEAKRVGTQIAPKWVCPSCDATNFQVKGKCGECGAKRMSDAKVLEAASRVETIEGLEHLHPDHIFREERERVDALMEKERRKREAALAASEPTREAPASPSRVESQTPDKVSRPDRRWSVGRIFGERLISGIREQPRWLKRVELAVGAVILVIGVEAYATDTYLLQGQITGSNGNYSVHYTNRKGESVRIPVILDEGQTLEMPIRPGGELVEIHGTRFGGVKAIHRQNKEIFVPQD